MTISTYGFSAHRALGLCDGQRAMLDVVVTTIGNPLEEAAEQVAPSFYLTRGRPGSKLCAALVPGPSDHSSAVKKNSPISANMELGSHAETHGGSAAL